MSDLRDAIIALADAVEELATRETNPGHDVSLIYDWARRARGIAQTVNGVAGTSEEVS